MKPAGSNQDSIRGAAWLMQPCMDAVLSIPYTAVTFSFFLSLIHPSLPDGLTWAGRARLAGAELLFWMTEVGVQNSRSLNG